MLTAKLILLQDVYDMKRRKEEELAFYHTELEKLKAKLSFVKTEIDLTNKIIDLIESDKIYDIKSKKD